MLEMRIRRSDVRKMYKDVEIVGTTFAVRKFGKIPPTPRK